MIHRLCLVATLAALSLTGCDYAEHGTDSATTADAQTSSAGDAAGVTPATVPTEGADATAPGAIAETASIDGPIFARPYPGSRVVSAVTSPQNDGGLIVLQTDADPGTVIAYYRARAEDAGMTARAEMAIGDTRQFGADTPQGGELNVEVTPQDARSTVTVSWQGVSG